jgi:photosystem II stability/assembly factor-like uncharacterized protein
VSVATPPRRPEIEQDRDLEQRVSDLEALIEEARRRARRRRTRRGGVALLLAAAGIGAFIGFGGQGGGGASSAATAHARSPQRSTANAKSPPLAALPADTVVSAFAFDPRNPNIVYVGTGVNNSSRSRVYKSTDAGGHWRLVSGPGWIWLGALASDPKHPGTLYASSDSGLYKTTDGGRTWHVFSRGLLPAHGEGYGALAVDPNNTNIIYSGVGGGVHKSLDAGHSWHTVLPLRRADWLALVVATRPTTIYANSFSKWHRIRKVEVQWLGLNSSTDGGKTWQRTSLHLALKSNALYNFAADPKSPTTLYAASQARIFISTNAGRSWQSIGHGLPRDSNVTSLAADAGTLYAALQNKGIYQTTDAGQTWTRSWPRTGTALGFRSSSLAIDPAHPATVYASTYSTTGRHTGNQILRSTDGGHTWATAP